MLSVLAHAVKAHAVYLLNILYILEFYIHVLQIDHSTYIEHLHILILPILMWDNNEIVFLLLIGKPKKISNLPKIT